MSNLAIKEAPLSERMGMAPAQLELIRRMCIRDDAPDDVLELYLRRCKAIGVDPFERMIYVIPRTKNVERNGRWQKELSWTFQSSIDLFRSIAEESGDYAGQLGPQWTGDGATWVDVWIAKTPPLACRVGILRNSFKETLWVTGTYDYYVQTDAKGQATQFWRGEKGAHQLAKCVEELALRKAFPRKLHGLYGNEEMEQADRPAKVAVEARPEAQDAAFEALPPAEQAEVVEAVQKVTDAANAYAERTDKRRKSVLISAREHSITNERRYAVTEALFPGKRSSNDLDYGQLGELREELKALVDAKIPAEDDDSFRAWLAWRADLRQEVPL